MYEEKDFQLITFLRKELEDAEQNEALISDKLEREFLISLLYCVRDTPKLTMLRIKHKLSLKKIELIENEIEKQTKRKL